MEENRENRLIHQHAKSTRKPYKQCYNSAMETNLQLLKLIKQIHTDCHKLCKQSLGTYLPVAGNIGIFCQSESEYNIFTELREKIAELSDNQDQKYYKLCNPINIPENKEIPQATYTYLYIRKPDSTPYGKYPGDVDFVLELSDYTKLKESVSKGEIKGAEIYDRPGWDTIQITDPNFKSVAYVSTKEFAEKVRVKF